MGHPLLTVLEHAAAGHFPPVDGGVTFLPELDDGNRAIVALTGHAYVAAPLQASDLDGFALDGFGGVMSPQTVLGVADRGAVGVNDMILVGAGTGAGADIGPTGRWDQHPRVRYAHHLRDDVRVHGDDRGFFTVARGLAGRREMSIELADPGRDPGVGRELIAQALAATPAGASLFAAVSPGNARSLRAFLAVGFAPLGSEILIDMS